MNKMPGAAFVFVLVAFTWNAAFAAPKACDEVLSGSGSQKTAVIVAAHRLPLTVQLESGEPVFKKSQGGLVSALQSVNDTFTWLGWPGPFVGLIQRHAIAEHLKSLDSQVRLRPVFLSDDEIKSYYESYSNQVIWPTFHGLTDLTLSSSEGWRDYQAVNRRYASQLVRQILHLDHGGTPILVWIHDYQLMLVPRYLRAALKTEKLKAKVKIGFFLHIPFPNFQVLGRLALKERLALLKGVGAADLIGFQTDEYRDDFHEAITENRIYSRAIIGTYPVGIDPAAILASRSQDETKSQIRILAIQYMDYRLLFGAERLDPIKGILEKLDGFSAYLESHPKERGHTVLYQAIQPSRIEISTYRQLHAEILRKVEQINTNYSIPGRLPPVVLNDSGLNKNEMIAYMSVATAVLVNSLRDGMNLVSFESEVAQKGRLAPAALVLSQNTGAAAYLKGALLVDPRNPNDLATAIDKAIQMLAVERRVRNRANLRYIEAATASVWMTKFLTDLANSPDRE